jgi:hypothetical protein
MLSRRLVFKAFIYLCIFHALSFLLSAVMEMRFMQFLSVQQLISSDFTYNDLFYRVQNKSDEDEVQRKHKEEIILINTAFLDNQNFRSELAELIHRVGAYKPLAIGVDFIFSNRPDEANDRLLKALKSSENIVCAYQSSANMGEHLPLPLTVRKGDVDFAPGQHSVRFYKGGEKTFAYQLFNVARGETVASPVADKERFPIAYSSIHDGVVPIDAVESPDYTKNYKVIDARSLLEEENTTERFESVLSKSIVIFGHMGSGPFDVEDKHAVPTDTTTLINRQLLMPGPAIHANALSNLLDDHIFEEPNSILFAVILNLVMLLMIILTLHHPSRILLLTGLVIFSIIGIWLSMYLMEFNIYIQVGVTLIELLIIEEFVESFDPFVVRIWERFRTKLKW